MSTPADKVLRKFENKINLGEFIKYISLVGYEKILQNFIHQEININIFNVTDCIIMLKEN